MNGDPTPLPEDVMTGPRFLRGLTDERLCLLLKGITAECPGFDSNERELIHTLVSPMDVREEAARRLIEAGAATGRRVR